MLWRLIRNIILLGLVLSMAIFLSSGSLSKWQEVKERLLAVSGKGPSQIEEVTPPAPPDIPLDSSNISGESKEVLLYFTDAKSESLIATNRTIPKVEGIARETIQALIDGPTGANGNHPVIPYGTKLLDINIRPDGLCIIDFSSELSTNLKGDAKSERMTVYSIVNTLTQFPSVERVKILINGQERDTLAGNEPISGELMRDETLITSGTN